MLVSNRYSFVKQIYVWSQTEKRKLQGTTYTLFFLYKSYRLFRQKYLFVTYTYTLGFPNRPYICLNFLVSFAPHHHYSVFSEVFYSKPYRYSSSQEEGLTKHRTSYFWQDKVYVCFVVWSLMNILSTFQVPT